MTEIKIEKTIHLTAPKSHVWEFLTKADLIAKWFNAPSKDLAPGEEFELAERDSGEVLCWGKVLEMSPTDFMAWDFTVGPANGHMSRVEWHLADAQSGTTLTLRHTGLPQTADGFGLILALDKGWHGFLNTLYEASDPKDYTATITTPATAEAAQNAILNEMHLWWSDRVELEENGFTIRFNKSHARFEFEASCASENQLVWRCTDANMIIENVDDTTEWHNSRLIWDITPTPTGSEVSLTHEGLNEKMECLDVCTRGWELYFENSLKSHLSGETPTPQTH
ncbi:MAG: SRPBCC domain-containing protein [Pseudomonadota bacterium]|nr:SRPBCC domain-containing protein [Pseudomonadota bacterium]